MNPRPRRAGNSVKKAITRNYNSEYLKNSRKFRKYILITEIKSTNSCLLVFDNLPGLTCVLRQAILKLH